MPKKCGHYEESSVSWLNTEEESSVSRRHSFITSLFKDARCSLCPGKELWLCMQCGFVGCGRLDQGHFVQHNHAVGMNMTSTVVWCFKCNREVDAGDAEDVIRKSLSGGRAHTKQSTEETFGEKVPIEIILRSPFPGIVNIGNTCFAAASLQCLGHAVAFRELLRYCPPVWPPESEGSAGGPLSGGQKLVLALRKFFCMQLGGMDPYDNNFLPDTKRGHTSLTPSEVISCIQRINSMFHGYHQHDAQEFLHCLLNAVHEESVFGKYSEVNRDSKDATGLSRPVTTAPPSLVSSVFMGETESTVTCLTCTKKSVCVEPFFDLSLSIPSEADLNQLPGTSISETTVVSPPPNSLWSRAKSWVSLAVGSVTGGAFSSLNPVTVQECLSLFSHTEKLTGPNAYLCEHCKKKTDSLKKIIIKSFPEVLVIHLKRFRGGGGYKLNQPVSYATDVEQFDGSAGADSPDSNPLQSYSLFGIIEHIGSSSSGGHYVSYCRTAPGGKEERSSEWYKYDDTRVSRIGGENLPSEPYILFYQKLRSERAVLAKNACPDGILTSEVGEVREFMPKIIPTRWVVAAKTMSFDFEQICSDKGYKLPALMTCSDLVCPHGHPAIVLKKLAKTQFTTIVDYDNFQPFKHIYQQQNTVSINSVELCSECVQYVTRCNLRFSTEHKLISKLDTKSIPDTESWYFINAQWISKWRKYLRTGLVTDVNSAIHVQPGPIDNTGLAELINKRNKIKITNEFIAVNQNVWKVFAHCHGVLGPVICSKTLNPGIEGKEITILSPAASGECVEGFQDVLSNLDQNAVFPQETISEIHWKQFKLI